MSTLVEQTTELAPDRSAWRLYKLLQTLLRERREMVRITERARLERLQRGYGHIPSRLWDRRSALFIERWNTRPHPVRERSE
jgi:hypothetical protein